MTINPSIRTINERPEARRIARHMLASGKLPTDAGPYWVNSFRFSNGRVDKDLIDGFGLNEMASWSDLGRLIERRLSPPKQELEPVYIGERPPSLRELRLERAEPEADTHSPAPAIRKPAEAKPARDWRSAIEGK